MEAEAPKPLDRKLENKMVRVRALRYVNEGGDVREPEEVFEIEADRRNAIPAHILEDAPGAEIGKPKPTRKYQIEPFENPKRQPE